MAILPPTHLFLNIISMVYGVANSKLWTEEDKQDKQQAVLDCSIMCNEHGNEASVL